MKRAMALLALLALAGCVAAAVVPVPRGSQERPAPPRTIGESALAGPWDRIVFERNSWGVPQGAWRLLPDGTGSWTETEREAGAPLDSYQLVRHELGIDPAAYARLRAIIESLPFPPPAYAGCTDFMTDQPYGTLRLEKDAAALEIAYNAGCRDDDYRPLIDGLRRADELVTRFGRDAPIVRGENPDRSTVYPEGKPATR